MDCGRPLFIWHSLHDKIFHICPSPTNAQLFSLYLTYPISLNYFLGVGAGAGQEDPLHIKLFWLSDLEGSAWLNSASPRFLKGFFKFVSSQRLLLILLLFSVFLYSLALFPPPRNYFVSLCWDLMHKLFYNLKFHCSWGCNVCMPWTIVYFIGYFILNSSYCSESLLTKLQCLEIQHDQILPLPAIK